MDERRRCTTVRQMELMVQFLEQHRDLALGRVRSKEARQVAARLWNECATNLNVEGPARTGKEWSKVWNDYKCRVRSKLVSINANQRATGGGPSNAPMLSPLEERTANILGRDVGPLADVRQDQFASNDGDGAVIVEVVDQPSHQLQETEASSAILIDHPQYVLSATSPVHVQSLPASPVPSLVGQTDSLQNSPRQSAERVRRVREPPRRRGVERVSRQLSTQITRQSARSALDESRAAILRIEEMRAEAALKYSQAFCNFSESVRLIAESIERFSQRYGQQHNHPV